MSNSTPTTAAELKDLLAQRSAGAYEQVRSLFDASTFVELGAYVKRTTTEFDSKGDANSEFEGVITGYGAIDGRLVFAFFQDPSRMKGALGAAHAKKICHLYDMALKNGAPVIGIFASAGAKIGEGVDALSGYGAIMKAVSRASGVIPQIAVLGGVCAGCAATVASMFDFVIGATDCAKLYVNAPYAAKCATGDDSIGSIPYAYENGLVTFAEENVSAALAKAKLLLNYLPANNQEGTVYALPSDDENRPNGGLEALLASGSYTAQDLLAELSDCGQYLELQGGYGKSIVTALCQLGGMVVGVVASNRAEHDGRLCPACATKAARFISMCDALRIPLLTLIDSDGLCTAPEAESAPFATALAQLAGAYASSQNAKVTVVVGHAYGSVFTLLGSKALGADVVFALDCAKISILAPEAAVEFLYADQIKAADDSAAEKDNLLTEWNTYHASPLCAARSGDIDDIIDYAEFRARICAAFEMLSAKSESPIVKLHSNLPL